MPYWLCTTRPATTTATTAHPFLDPPQIPTPLRPTSKSPGGKKKRTASKRPRDDVGGGNGVQSDDSDSRASSPALKYEEPSSTPFAPFGSPAWGASESQSTIITMATGTAQSRSPPLSSSTLLLPPPVRAVPDQDPCVGGVVSLMYSPPTSTTCSLKSMALGAGCDARDRALWWQQQQQHQSISSTICNSIIDGELGARTPHPSSYSSAVVPPGVAGGAGGGGTTKKGHMPLGVRRLTGGVLTNLPVIHPTLRPLDTPQVPTALSSRGVDAAQLPTSYVQHSPTVCYRVFVPMDHILTSFNDAIKPPTHTPTTAASNGAFGRVDGDVDFISEVMRLVLYHIRVACGCGGIAGQLPPKDMQLVKASAKALLPQCVYDTLMKVLPHPTHHHSSPRGSIVSGPPGFPVGVHTLHTLFSFDGFSYLKNCLLAAGTRNVKRGTAKGSSSSSTTAAGKDGGGGSAGGGDNNNNGYGGVMDDEGSNSMPIMMTDPTSSSSATTTNTASGGVDTSSRLVVPFGKVAVLGQGGGMGGVMGGTSVLFDLLRVIAAEQERRSDVDDVAPPAPDAPAEEMQTDVAAAGEEKAVVVIGEEAVDISSFDRCWDKYIESLPPPPPLTATTAADINNTPAPPLPTSTTTTSSAPAPPPTTMLAPPVSDGFVPAVFNDEWAVCSGVHITVVVGPRAGCTHQVAPQEGSLCATYPTYTTTPHHQQQHGAECAVSGCQQFEIIAVSPVYERAAASTTTTINTTSVNDTPLQ